MNAPPADALWTTELVYRMRHLFTLKLVGTTVLITLFFVAYFQLLRHPAYPVATMPLTALDRLVPFRPEALFPYLSLWLYVGIGPGMQRDLAELLACGLWMVAMCVTGLAIFHFWPTAVPPMGLDASGFFGFQLLQGVDAAGNACPSMHVAAAMFTVIRIAHVLRGIGAPRALRTLNVLWFVAIAWSTLATRQHVALDAAGGALLGILFALSSLHRRRR
ncbi:MAG: phosphatase PAP2 family protein [Janthinobacterium lividum]